MTGNVVIKYGADVACKKGGHECDVIAQLVGRFMASDQPMQQVLNGITAEREALAAVAGLGAKFAMQDTSSTHAPTGGKSGGQGFSIA